MTEQMKESTPGWVKDPPPLMLVPRHIGDSVWELRSTDAGFVMRSLVLRPQAN